jgi:putative membrane protein
MKLRLFGVGVLAVVVALAAGRSAADEDKPFDDKEFVQNGLSGGILEVKLGELAMTKASNDLVKKFGERMTKDHAKVNEELTTVAKAMQVTVPDKMNDNHQKEFDKFGTLSGAEFDKAYIDFMVKDHEHDVKMFKKATTEAKNSQLRVFATKTLPGLEEHLKMAKEIQTQVSK